MARKKLKAPRIWIWVLGITLTIALIIGGATWYLSRQWKPILDTQLKDLVVQASDSLYRIEYSDLKLNLVTGNATISKVRLIPDKRIYKKLVSEHKAPDNVYDLQVDKAVIKSFHPKLLYSQKRLDVNTILIDNPTLFITNRRQPYNEVDSTKKPQTLYQLISKGLKEVRVGEILLRNINFTFDNRSDKPFKKTAIKNLNVSATDLLIDSLSETDKKRFFHTRKIDVNLKNYTIATPDSLYYLAFKNLGFSTANKQVFLDQVSLVPRYSKTQFYKKVGYAKDRFNIDFYKILIKGINLQGFLRDQRFYANSLNVIKGYVEVYNNPAYGRKKEVKKDKFPHQQLQKLALNLRIDTVNFKNVGIGYTEYNPLSKRTGRITFDRTSGKFYNVTNDPVSLSKSHIMRADIGSRFMNSGNLVMHFTLNLTSPKGVFAYSGALRNMDGRMLNKITRPLGLIEVNSVLIEKLAFNVKANENVSRGSMQFYYKNLNVNVLKKDGESGGLKKQGLISTVANVLVIHEDNPNRKGEFTAGRIYHKRLAYESFFSYIWKSLFTGVKESVGVSSEKENKIRNTVEQVGGFMERIKAKRAENKQERLEKRTERKQEREQRRKEKEAVKTAEREEKEVKEQLAKKDSL